MGQSLRHTWPERTGSVEDMVRRLRARSERAAPAAWPDSWSRWGGWADRRVAATGFFRTHHDGRRWWLVDPDGCLFWSSGMDCVHPTIDHETRYETTFMNLRTALAWFPGPDSPLAAALGRNPYHHADDREINFVQANFMRAFGPDRWYQAWQDMIFRDLRGLGVNTAGDWSDEPAASRAGFPYVRALELALRFDRTPMLVDRFPDVFDAGLEQDAAAWAEQLRPTVSDPAMIGYFMHNEPPWHFGNGTVSPIEHLVLRGGAGRTRQELVRFLQSRHPTDAALAAAWAMPVGLADVAAPDPFPRLTPAASQDLQAFSTIAMARLFSVLSDACRRVDPNHLNLGVRWWTFPPLWALRAMSGFDVISFNCYQPKPDRVHYGLRAEQPGTHDACVEINRPFMIGEWHIGAFGGGVPSAGLYAAASEVERANAFRVYLEHAAAQPWCVGAHWFNFYDRPVMYSPTGSENYHIGFFDITHRPWQALGDAARTTNDRIYHVAAGDAAPHAEPVRYVFPSR
jgi:hypothetical protein